MKKVSTVLKGLALGVVLASALTGAAFAETVYFRGQRVSWDHGRKLVVISYSEVQTHQFEHCSTANTTWSGWKEEGVLASAEQFVGTSKATAYWDCR